MSMLAERKIKQKWCLNPRGNLWSDDSNKFGQKILEKMGWSKGKGLGANEDGMVDHVKISYKNDAKGMGYKETNDQWTEHDAQFNNLLQSLSGESPTETDAPKISLEQKSLKSKRRVHYQKFTRGKDLSRYSEKDLANIFGKKTLDKQAKIGKEEVKIEDSKYQKNAGSMVDYFQKKLPNFGKSDYKVGSNGVLVKGSDSEEERVGFGFKRSGEEQEQEIVKRMKFDDNNGLEVIVEENEDAQENGKGKKKKKKKDAVENGLSNVNFEEVGEEKFDNNTFEVKRKKKKKEQNISCDVSKVETENGLPNMSFMETGADETIDNNTFEVKRKKKKKDKIINDGHIEVTDDSCEVRKRKKTKEKGLSNVSFMEIEEEEKIDNNIFEVKRKVEKNDSFEVKKKKKKKEDGLSNMNFIEIEEPEKIDNNTFEVKRKKKKDRELNETDKEIKLDDVVVDNNSFEVQRKKKKKKENAVINENKQENGLDNPNLNISNEETFDLILNVTSTPVTPVTPSRSSLKRRKSVRFSETNEEHIIPSNEEHRNELFDINSQVIANGLEEMSRKIDNCQAEIENDMNESKIKKKHVKVEEGVILRYGKNVKFSQVPGYILREKMAAKKSYKHLIKGDVLVGFRNSNLHEIEGYAERK